MVMKKKKRMGTILLITAIIIVLGLSTYFFIKELYPTGNVVAKVADNDMISKITTPAKAANTNPILTSNNSAGQLSS